MNINLKNLFSFLFSLVFGVLILIFVYKHQQGYFSIGCDPSTHPHKCSLLNKTLSDFKGMKLQYILLAIIFSQISNFLRSIRWKLLMKPLGYDLKYYNAFGAVQISYMSSLIIPRIGELVRAKIVSKYENIPLDKAIGTIIVERIIDIVMFFILSLLILIISYNHLVYFFINEFNKFFIRNMNYINSINLISKFIIVLFILGGLVVYVKRESIFSKFNLYLKLKSFKEGLLIGVYSLKDVEYKFLFIVYTLLIWLFYLGMVYVSFFSYEPTSTLGIEAALVVLSFGSLGLFIPTPSGMGSYHYLVVKALSIYGISTFSGFAFANVQFFTTAIISTLLFGLIAYLVLPILNRQQHIKQTR